MNPQITGLINGLQEAARLQEMESDGSYHDGLVQGADSAGKLPAAEDIVALSRRVQSDTKAFSDVL